MSETETNNAPSPSSKEPKKEEARSSETKFKPHEQTNVKPTETNDLDKSSETTMPEQQEETKKTEAPISEAEETAEAGTPLEEIDPVTALENENADLKDKMLRLAADMENLRRRTEREKQDMAKYAISNFARDLLTIDDNLSRALEAVPEGATEKDPALKALVDGVEMTSREFINICERNNISRISPKGEIFDPNCHQAMFEIPNPEVPAGTIMEVVASGFMIGSRVLRPAMVGVAKGGEKPKKEKPAEETDQPEKSDDTVDKTV